MVSFKALIKKVVKEPKKKKKTDRTSKDKQIATVDNDNPQQGISGSDGAHVSDKRKEEYANVVTEEQVCHDERYRVVDRTFGSR
jgi:hypothetical protein